MRLDAPRLIQCINWPNGNANQTEEREKHRQRKMKPILGCHTFWTDEIWFESQIHLTNANALGAHECVSKKTHCGSVCVCVWRVSVWWIFFRRKFINAACMHVCNARIFANFSEILRVGVFVCCIRKTGKDINLNRKVLFWSLSLFCATIPYSAA